MARKKKANLKEGEYPTRVPVETPDGDRYSIETTRIVPPAERLVAPIKETLLSSFLHNLFDEINIKGKTGQDALLLLCRMGAWRYDTLRKFCVAWEDLHQPNLFHELYPELEFKEPTLEQCCQLAELDNERFVGDVYAMLYYYGGEAARVEIHAGLQDVARAAYKNAVESGARGFQDRQMLLKAGGVVQEGPGTVVNFNNTLNSATLVQGLPKWEETDKILSRVLQTPRALPPKMEGGDVECTADNVETSTMEPMSAPAPE